MSHTIISTPTIPENQRRYSPENRVVHTPVQLQDGIEGELREEQQRRMGGWWLRLEDVEGIVQRAMADYTAVWEAYCDAIGRETRLRQCIRQEILDEYFPEGEPIDDKVLARLSLHKALVAAYGEVGEDLTEGWFMFGWHPDTAGPPMESVVDAVAEEAGTNG